MRGDFDEDEQACMPDGNAMLLAEAVSVAHQLIAMRQALRVIQKGLTEDADGEFWSARKWLDKRGIFHDDVSGYRVLDLVAKHALKGKV
jgi:hypothetical protein